MTYLGMQIMVEGLALAAFGFMYQLTEEPLLKQLLRYVMSDEARHVAFGVLSLKEYYAELSDAELRERQEFAFEAAVRMRDRFLQQEVWERMGVDTRKMVKILLDAPPDQLIFQQMLFSKIVPNCKKLGPARCQRRLAAPPVRGDRRHPVRGLGRHRRGVPTSTPFRPPRLRQRIRHPAAVEARTPRSVRCGDGIHLLRRRPRATTSLTSSSTARTSSTR